MSDQTFMEKVSNFGKSMDEKLGKAEEKILNSAANVGAKVDTWTQEKEPEFDQKVASFGEKMDGFLKNAESKLESTAQKVGQKLDEKIDQENNVIEGEVVEVKEDLPPIPTEEISQVDESEAMD